MRLYPCCCVKSETIGLALNHYPLPATMNKLICLLALLAISFSLSADQVINTSIANEWPNERYEVHGDGTVTDTVTGLMWLQCSLGQDPNDNCSGFYSTHDWQEALETAESYSLGAYSDWRLPNIKELDSLAALDRYDPAINSTVFPNTPSNQYWSASPEAGESSNADVWLLDFDNAGDGKSHRLNRHRVRLVRSGQ